MSVIDDLTPKTKHRLMDLVERAGVDVSDWANYKGGKARAAANPNYCLESAFMQPDECVVLVVGSWLAYRIVNVPKFADFLIAVEAEMAKVSWPTRTELYRQSMVVIAVIFILVLLLFTFDLIWGTLFKWIGVIRS